MARTYEEGYAQALAEIGDEFARLADQAQGEINTAIQQCRKAQIDLEEEAEDQATHDLHEAMRLKLGWMNALRITMAAEARHQENPKAA